MTSFDAIALALRYPGPGSLDEVRSTWEAMPVGGVRRHLLKFLGEIEHLGLSGWEELHTRTLDLAPIFAPYVGYMIWGDSYQRGEFMAEMKVAQDEAGIDREGELPDHLDPLSRYLAVVDEPPPRLVELFPEAIALMKKTLKAAEKKNPYRHVLGALEEAGGKLASPVGGAR
jgi:nitrate reductase delta subunit